MAIPKTTLQELIEVKLDEVKLDELAKNLGYSEEKFKKRLEIHLSNEFLGMDKGTYDFKYQGKEFISELACWLGIDEEIVQNDLNKIQRYLSKCKNNLANIFIETDFDFKKNTQPIFILSCLEGRRRMSFDCAFSSGSKVEVLNEIKTLVKNHFAENQGQLFVWGHIKSYLFTDIDSKQTRFYPDGRVESLSKIEPVSGMATLSIR